MEETVLGRKNTLFEDKSKNRKDKGLENCNIIHLVNTESRYTPNTL